MKIKEFLLNESKEIIIAKKDAPNWVKEILGTSYPQISVIIDEEPRVGGKFVDYDVMTIYFFNGKNVGKTIRPNILGDEREKQMYHGAKIKLSPTFDENLPQMILQTSVHPKKATLYIHPDAVPSGLISGGSDLTEEERYYLAVTKSYISSYRMDYYKKLTRDIKKLDEIKASLIKKGMLDTRGVVTLKGKNEILSFEEKTPEAILRKIKGE